MRIESRIGKSAVSDQKIYNFISIFHNFKELLPADKVSGWESSEEKCSYLDFSLRLLETEINQRSQRDLERRNKGAKLPVNHDLSQYDYSFINGISKQQLSQLRECLWHS